MIRIGTRKSQLALWQANFIRDQLLAHDPAQQIELVHFTTTGDRIQDKPLPEIGGKGLFTEELEHALQAHEIDLAVHSLKDLPTQMPAGFMLGAVPQRAAPFDALISKHGYTLQHLPQHAVVGTSSLRRSAQLQAARPDLLIKPLRGNVDTRVQKALSGDYDAIVLAVAGLARLGKEEVITEIIDTAIMLPAPGQGALGVQCRADDAVILPLLQALDDPATRAQVTAERAFLQHLEAGCRLPVSAYATLAGDQLHLTGRVSGLDGKQTITVEQTAPLHEAFILGQRLAGHALQLGADELLATVKQEYPL